MFIIADWNPGIRHVDVERFARTDPRELSGTGGVADRKVNRNLGASHVYQQNNYKINKKGTDSSAIVFFNTCYIKLLSLEKV